MNKHICIRETYDWIYVGDGDNRLTKGEFDELLKYLENKKESFKSAILDIKYKKLRLINYVGIISIKSVVIEIIPKVSLSNDKKKDKQILLQMLSKCNKLPFDINDSISLNLADYNLIELLAKYFIERLQLEVDKGIYCEYINKEDNLNFIKGKLLLSNHVKRNHVNKIKAYCSYDEYSENNYLNLVFKTAGVVILRMVNNNDIKNHVKRLISCFADVDLIYLDKNKLSKYKFNRQNYRFKESYQLAKLILLSTSMENSLGDENAFSMLFEMNTLYEEYIGKILEQIWNNDYRNTLLQDDDKYLLKNSLTKNGNFNLKPDIVLTDEKEDYQIIIDTKWKANNSKIEPSDIYQMYAYITRYEKSRNYILLYPYNEENNDKTWCLYEPFGNKKIQVKTVRLDSIDTTMEDLNRILKGFN